MSICPGDSKHCNCQPSDETEPDATRWCRHPAVALCQQEYESTHIRADLVPQWLPIETAPEPGVYQFLVGRAESSGAPSVQQVIRLDDGFWIVGMAQYFKNPTHWMPLPKPPSGGAWDERRTS